MSSQYDNELLSHMLEFEKQQQEQEERRRQEEAEEERRMNELAKEYEERQRQQQEEERRLLEERQYREQQEREEERLRIEWHLEDERRRREEEEQIRLSQSQFDSSRTSTQDNASYGWSTQNTYRQDHLSQYSYNFGSSQFTEDNSTICLGSSLDNTWSAYDNTQ